MEGFDCFDGVIAQGREFLAAFDAMERTNVACADTLRPRRLSVTMITFTAKLSQALSQSILRDMFGTIVKGSNDFFTASETAKTLAPGFKSVLIRGRFNAITVQLFHGGKVQIAGCRCHLDAVVALQELMASLHEGEPALRDIRVTQFDTQLINFNSALGTKIRIDDAFVEHINDALAPLTKTRRAEKRENYAPLSIYMPSTTGAEDARISSRLFSTGSLVISGRCAKDLAVAYDFILTFLKTHAAAVLIQVTDVKELAAEKEKHARCWTELADAMPGLKHTHLPTTATVPGCLFCQTFGNVFAIAPIVSSGAAT